MSVVEQPGAPAAPEPGSRHLREPLARARPRLPRAVHGHPRRHDRERRAAVDPARPRLLGRRPPVGDQLATRWCSAASCCSAAAPPTSSAGGRLFVVGVVRVLGRLAAQRPLDLGRDADRRAAACRVSAPRSSRPAALSIITTTFAEGAGAHEGARRLGRDRRRRRRVRPAAGRHPHRPALVGVDLLRQRAGRHRRRAARARATCRSRAPSTGRTRSTSPARCR